MLVFSGMYRLEISHNPLTDIPDDAFFGLDRALWELRLHDNELIDVPSKALRHLQKLRVLDLSSNNIGCIELDSFRGLEESLAVLSLADNSLNALKPDSFMGLSNLEDLDLSGNNLGHIDMNLFRDGMPKLSKVCYRRGRSIAQPCPLLTFYYIHIPQLSLADNLLFEIPYISLGPLRALRHLDVSHNVIKTIPQDDPTFDTRSPAKLTLDTLHLGFNAIESIPTGAFSRFDVMNVTFLDGNPINHIGDEAFRAVKMRELYIRHCGLSIIGTKSFVGMSTLLQLLDLSGNNITELPENLLRGFDDFR